MNKHFKGEVKSLVKDEHSGEETLETEIYIVKAVNYTDAEASITQQMVNLNKKSFSITKIDQIKLHGFVDMDSEDPFYSIKTSYFVESGKAGKDKKVVENLLVRATSIQKAITAADKFMRDSSPIISTIIAATEFVCEDVFLNNMSGVQAVAQFKNQMAEDGVEFTLELAR